MSDLQDFLYQVFTEEWYSKSADEKKETLSMLNDDKTCVMYEDMHTWVMDTFDMVIPAAPDNFRLALIRTIDFAELREDVFNFLEGEGFE
jgi:hypothetical protein